MAATKPAKMRLFYPGADNGPVCTSSNFSFNAISMQETGCLARTRHGPHQREIRDVRAGGQQEKPTAANKTRRARCSFGDVSSASKVETTALQPSVEPRGDGSHLGPSLRERNARFQPRRDQQPALLLVAGSLEQT